jgi:hypothetical protein
MDNGNHLARTEGLSGFLNKRDTYNDKQDNNSNTDTITTQQGVQ